MKPIEKSLILVACVALAAVFLVPIWHIRLDAPQYPEGLDMYVWVSKIAGNNDFTLQNINILNHYIGMKAIVPDSFKELQIMPWVLGFFILSGIAVSFSKKRGFPIAWFALLIVGGIIGLGDFYLWLQNFGTDLDPAAPIQMEGMSYSPPFLGKKVLLNITASSYPAAGGILFGIALALASAPCLFHLKSKRHSKSTLARHKTAANLAIPVLALLMVSCSSGPQPINYGFDACDNCRMTISNPKYGAELITDKGKVFKFDAVECMLAFETANQYTYSHLLVSDINSEEFTDATKAFYLQSPKLPSPMGANLNAVSDNTAAEALQKEYGGKLMEWEAVHEVTLKHAH